MLGVCSALLTALVTEIYAHRYLAHRAFRLHPRFEAVLDAYFRVVVGTDARTWARVHRLHHRYADTPDDPHSPLERRPATVLLGSAYLFAVAKKRVPRDAPKGGRILAIRFSVIAFYVAVFGAGQVLVMFVVHLIGYLGVMGMVNTVGHIHGRKPHPDVPGYDAAWLAIPLLGHGYHNSHHAHPSAARTGPLDPVWPLLRLLAALRLTDLNEARAPQRARTCCPAAAAVAPS